MNASIRKAQPSPLLVERAGMPSKSRQQLLLVYVLLIAWVGVLVLAQCASALASARREDLVLLAAISVVAPSIFVLLSAQDGHRIPIAFALSVTAIVLFGAETAAWLGGLAATAALLSAGLRQPLRIAFGAASYVLSA